MAERRLSAEEHALWSRVAATVRALGAKVASVPPSAPAPAPVPPASRSSTRETAALPARAGRPVPPPDTLDGGWDRRLRRGTVAPDRTVDLHGHTLASAHDALDHALDRAIADDVRLLLIVTGRPPRPGDHQSQRGLIRAGIGDWLAASRHADRIAAVRHAHPRHGGAGALYLVLRRRRDRI